MMDQTNQKGSAVSPIDYTPPKTQGVIIQTSEPRRLTFDEASQLLAIQDTPDAERTDEQRRIWKLWKDREAWEDEQRRESILRREELDKQARAYRANYHRQLQGGCAKNSVESFKAELLRSRGSSDGHRFGLEDDVANIRECLELAYISEVRRVGRAAIIDEFTVRILDDVSRWLSVGRKDSLILRGNVGVGKTTILRAISRLLALKTGAGVAIWDARKIANLGKGDNGQKILDELASAPMLGIDDLGSEPSFVKNYGNDITPIADLLLDRYARRRPTIITTNLAVVTREGLEIDEITEIYGDRIADRFNEQYSVIRYDAAQSSYRGR